jgi:hypothetical protein
MSAPNSLTILARLGTSTQTLTVDFNTPVRSLKSQISLAFQIPPALSLFHKGQLLRSDSLITDILNVIVLPLPSQISFKLQFAGKNFSVEADPLGPVSELRETIADRLGLSPSQFVLVCNGQVLIDDFTLSFFDIFENAVLYLLANRSNPRDKPRPTALARVLESKIREYPVARRPIQMALVRDITEIITNPMFQAFAHINQEVKELVEKGLEVIDQSHSTGWSDRNAIVAARSDAMLNQMELARGGMSVLEGGYHRTQAESFVGVEPAANLDYEGCVSEMALPAWWNQERDCDVEPRRIQAGENFSKQIRVLKKMGFADEAAIQFALTRSSGNVTRAAEFLRSGNESITRFE